MRSDPRDPKANAVRTDSAVKSAPLDLLVHRENADSLDPRDPVDHLDPLDLKASAERLVDRAREVNKDLKERLDHLVLLDHLDHVVKMAHQV